MAGRKCKLNQEIQDRIVDFLKKGNYIETAAASAGVSKNTLYDWLKRGARETERIEKGEMPKVSEGKFVIFADAVEMAMAQAEARDVNLLYDLSKDDAKVLQWRLSHRYPDRWGKKERHELSGKDDSPIVIDISEGRKKLVDMLTKEDEEEKE